MTDDSFVARVERLREVATELDDCHTEDEVYEHVVGEADRILSFDSAIAVVVEEEAFCPRAVQTERLTPGTPLTTEEGLVGKTFREGETQVVPDVDTSEIATSTSDTIKSVLSIPVEDEGVLQFHRSTADGFSEMDRRIGELLSANVSNTLERVRYEQALGQERDQFAALFENVPDAALQYRIEDGKQIIEAVNSAFVSIFGASGAEVVGEQVEAVMAPTRDCPAQRVEADVSDNVEVVRESVDGPRPFLLRNVPIRTTDDSLQGYLIYTDLSAQKEREQELQRKNERLDEFASILSHDLRNPLNIAQLYTEQELLGNDSEPLEKTADALDRIDQLITDVLTLTRSEQGIDPEPDVDLGRTARRAWETVDTGGSALEVTGQIDCTADRTQLKRLLENLFRNSVEHGDRAVTVRVEPLEDGFAVEDNGPGIPPDQREKVFDSGYTSSGSNTGLGLAIVERIASTHDWSVTVTDGESGGARFEFRGTDARITQPTDGER